MKPRARRAASAARVIAAALVAGPAAAGAQQDGRESSTVVVTATREASPRLDAPMALDVIDADALRDRHPGAGVSGLLARVPGVFVNDRETMAQEQTIAVRGFGARAAFGVRGIRLLLDGLPASTPDGQGGTAMFDLSSAARIEVLRGPFSALYGNHAAGVIQVFTREAPDRPTASLRTGVAEGGQSWLNLQGGARGERLDAVISASHLDNQGWRDWSRGRMDQLHTRLRWRLGERTTLAAIVNAFEQPDSLDPLGLTAEQMAADPTQASPAAREWRTRRELRHALAGLVLDHADEAGRYWHATLHGARRENLQTLAFSGTGPTSAGGVSGFERRQNGVSLHVAQPLPGGARLVLGAELERAAEERRGWVNVGGEAGALKRDETDTVAQAGVFAQAQWRPAAGWNLHAGVRRSWVRFDSRDRFITATNPDDSGAARYAAWTPALGLSVRLSPSLAAYANVGRSFETPTFAELSYRPGGASGLNFALRPSLSRHAEVGLRGGTTQSSGAPAPGAAQWQVAVFGVRTHDEIVVASSIGGRTVYGNAAGTRRIGLEASMETSLTPTLSARAAATWLRARFTAALSPPSGPVPAGTQLPGVPTRTLHAELAWRPSTTWSAALEARARDAMTANDRGSASAGGALTLAARLGWTLKDGDWTWRALLRLDNLTDRRMAAAVYVNDANARYYAPAGPRALAAQLQFDRRF